MFASATKSIREREPVDFGAALRGGASILALCAFAVATPAFAQEAPNTGQVQGSAGEPAEGVEEQAPGLANAAEIPEEPAGDEIIVTGIRQSLANAQSIKRNSDTVVDAITAEDIGALPDRSVTEALQRVPGVAINRFAGSNDPDHFSVEGSGVVIRGLNFVRSEFNGRDTFSANAGRSLGFADVPAELLGSVEVYKNFTAEMIEGGLAGTVNLNTRVPFTNRGFHLGFSAEANYSDFIKEVTPTFSALVSNTWETGIGTFGLLGSVAYSQVKSRADGMQVTNFQTRDAALVTQALSTNILRRNRLPGSETCAIPNPPAAGPNSESGVRCTAFAPLGATFRTQLFDRERAGYAAAGQWESNDRTMLLTAQFLRSDARQSWGERTFEAGGDLSEYNTFPVGCGQVPNTNTGGTTTAAGCVAGQFQDYQYDEDGVFEKGFITFPGTGWRSFDSGSPDARVPTGGSQYNNTRREVLQDTMTADYGLNFKWNPNERWSVNLDAQYVKATTENLDFSATGSIFADTELDLTGDIPQAVVHKPQITRAAWAAPNKFDGVTDEQYFTDRSNYFWRSAMDHIEDSEGEEWAFKADVAYDFQDDIPGLRRIKVGARYADRDQTVRSSTYNWGVLSEVWAGNAGAVHFDESPQLPLEQHEFKNFFRGQANAPPPSFYYGRDLIQGYFQAVENFRAVNAQWNRDRNNTQPATGGGSGWVPLAARPGVVAGTPFLPGEIQDVSEETKAAYVMLSFGSDEPVFGNIRIDGNIGVRYVNTEAVSSGFISFPQATAVGGGQPFSRPDGTGFCDPRPIPPNLPPGSPAPRLPAVCDLGPAFFAQAQQFSNGGTIPNDAADSFDNWLPSLNVKIGVGEDVIVRLAASKVLARPDIGLTRNFVNIGTDTSSGFRFQAASGNPFVRPVTALTFDAGIEWYFARVGSLTFNAFYKDIEGFFVQGVNERELENNGVTFPVFVRGPRNFEENGKVKGFEAAYQQTFDFLPGALNGFGTNLNYTYVESKGVPNSFISVTTESPIGTPGNLPLEQLSKHNANATVFYEKYGLSARVSYSWRSKFLLTARDVIFPYFPIYNDETGQVDASIFYSLTPQIKVGFQGNNLTNEVLKTIQVYTPDGREAPRSYFMNDRRITFAIRGNF